MFSSVVPGKNNSRPSGNVILPLNCEKVSVKLNVGLYSLDIGVFLPPSSFDKRVTVALNTS